MRTLAISLTCAALWGSILPAHGHSYHYWWGGWTYYGSRYYGPSGADAVTRSVGPGVYRESPEEARQRDLEWLARGGKILQTYKPARPH